MALKSVKTDELVLADGKTLEEVAADPNHYIVRGVRNAAESFNKEDRSFDCRNCGSRYVPSPDQWIFHNLCDPCFVAYDTQKMSGRMAGLFGQPVPEGYVEDSEEWVRRQRALRS